MSRSRKVHLSDADRQDPELCAIRAAWKKEYAKRIEKLVVK